MKPRDRIFSALLRAIGCIFFVLAGALAAKDQGLLAFIGAMIAGHIFISLSMVTFFFKTEP